MRKLYLHIGAHKAGSTSFQDALSENSDRLRKSGVRYINTGRQHQVGPHHRLTSAARRFPGEKSLALFMEIAEEIQGSDERIFVLSTESLENLVNPQALYPFVALKTELELELIVMYFVRQHAEQLNSAYVQLVRQMKVWDLFDDFFGRRINIYNRRYRRCVELWSPIADKMIVLEFSANTMEEVIRNEFSLSIKLGHANRSINALAVEALRCFSEKMHQTKAPKAALAQRNADAIEGICLRAAKFDSTYRQFWGLSGEQCDTIKSRSSSDAEFLRQNFGIKLQRAPARERSIVIPPYNKHDKELLDYVIHGQDGPTARLPELFS